MSNFPTRQDQIRAAYHNWNVNRGADEASLLDMGYDTPATLSDTLDHSKESFELVKSVGEGPVSSGTELELVDDDHVPQEGARREATLRNPKPARTPKEKRTRDEDQGRRSQGITPLGHDPLLISHDGGQ